jgi:hypothetical protein
MALSPAPFDANTLTVPLDAVTRAKVVAWTEVAQNNAHAHGWSNTTENVAAMSDDQLIGYYKLQVGIATFKIPGFTINPVTDIRNSGVTNPLTGQSVSSPLTSVNQFLGNLSNPNTWVRVAEFLAGGLILTVALNAVLRNGKPIPKPSTVAKGLVK